MLKQSIPVLVLAGLSTFGWSQAAAPAAPAASPQLEDASSLVQRMKQKLSQSSTISGTLEVSDQGIHEIKFKAMRPNYVSVMNDQFEIHSDGAKITMYMPTQHMYMDVPPAQAPKIQEMLIGFEPVMGADPSYTVSGKAKPGFFRGSKVVSITMTKSGQDATLYIDPDKLQPVAFVGKDGKMPAVYKDIVLGSDMKAADFTWTPPSDAKSMADMMKEAAAKGQGSPASTNNVDAGKLLAVGTAAPDFTMATPTGGKLTLSKSLGKKATIVNFWADFCGPCHAEMPVFVKLYKQLKPQGLEIISIDDGDDAKTILKDAKENGFSYLLGMNGKDKAADAMTLYGIEAFPTNYIIDANGKIVDTIVGFDEDGLKQALTKLGFKI